MTIRKLMIAAAFALGWHGGANAQSGGPYAYHVQDYSQTLGTTPVQIWPQDTAYLYSFLFNAAPTGGGNIWCSYTLTASTSTVLAPNTAGAFELVPGNLEQFPDTNFIPTNALWCVATAAGTPLTAYARAAISGP